MLHAVVECVGLLAPPRSLATSEDVMAPMTEEAKSRLRSANMTKLRALLMRLLGVHRSGGGLDLEDISTCKALRVMMERLNYLLEGRGLEGLASSRQWIAISRAFDMADMTRGKMVPPQKEDFSRLSEANMVSRKLASGHSSLPVVTNRVYTPN